MSVQKQETVNAIDWDDLKDDVRKAVWVEVTAT